MIAILNNKRVQIKTSTSHFTKAKMRIVGVKHWLRAIANDDAMGIAIGSGFYIENSSIQIKAIAKPGYKFIQWSDGSIDTIKTIVIDADIELVAYFEKDDTKGILTYITNKDYINL